MSETTTLTTTEVAEAVAYWLSERKGKFTRPQDVKVTTTSELRGHGPTEEFVPVVKVQVTRRSGS